MNQQFTKLLSILITGLFSTLLLTGCGQQGGSEIPAGDSESDTPASAEAAANEAITELEIIDLVEGDGAVASAGQNVVVHYTGWLYDPAAPDNRGAQFDSSVDRGQPFGPLNLGAGRVIKGWDEGLVGMKVGGKRQLIIPPHLAYGEGGAGNTIPPNATLIYEVELLAIKDY